MSEHYRNGALTVVSLSNDVPDMPDRRDDSRNLSVLRSAIFRTAHGEELCLVRNISSGGLMAHVYSDLEPGTTATVEFRSEHSVRGHVVWSRDRLVGIQFNAPADVAALLTDRPAPAHYQPRPPRVGVQAPARIRSAGCYQPVLLCNISQGGAKLCASNPDQLGKDVVLVTEGLPPLTGSIRWMKGDYIGVSFNKLIPFSEVAHWIASAQLNANLGIHTPPNQHGARNKDFPGPG